MVHQPENALLRLVAQEEFHASLPGPGGAVLADRRFVAGVAEFCDRLGRKQHADLAPAQLRVERAHELEDARIPAVVLAEGLEIPAEGDHVTPALAYPVRIHLRRQRPHAPGLVREAIADVV